MTVATMTLPRFSPPTSLNAGSDPVVQKSRDALPSSVNGISIVTGCAKSVPAGSQRNTFERTVNPSGPFSVLSRIVICFVSASAPFGMVTFAPLTSMTAPSGPTDWVTLPELPELEPVESELLQDTTNKSDAIAKRIVLR